MTEQKSSDPDAAITARAGEVAAKVPLKLVQILMDEIAIAEVIEAALATVQQETRQEERERCAQMVERLADEVITRMAGKDEETQRWAIFAVDCLREGATAIRSQNQVRSRGGETR